MDNLYFGYEHLVAAMEYLLSLRIQDDALFVKPETGLVVIYDEAETVRAILENDHVRMVVHSPYGIAHHKYNRRSTPIQVDQSTGFNAIVWTAIVDHGLPLNAKPLTS